MPQSLEALRYENPDLWDRRDWTERTQDIRRARAVLAALSPDAKIVLDLGCGNGLLARENQRTWRIISLDRSLSALRAAEGYRSQADAAHLPFEDDSFDAVAALELLEHLPQAAFQATLAQIVRVCRKQILVTVPYCENLAHSQIQCPACGTQFHPYFHLRSFGASSLTNLFQAAGWRCVRLEGLEPIRRRRLPEVWDAIRRYYHRQGANFPSHALCPMCGYSRQSDPGDHRPAGKPSTLSGLKQALTRTWPSVPSYQWWLAVYHHD